MNDELKDERWRKFINGVLLACILLGIACRFVGLDWDASFHLHPDERFLTMTTSALDWPRSPRAYFETRIAPLNPFNGQTDFFVYGQLPLVLTKVIAACLGRDTPDGLVLVGRFLSASFDTLTILFVFLIGRKVSGSALLGLLAAAFLSLAALHIQHGHFFVVDTFAVTFLAATFYFALVPEKNSTSRITHSTLAGVCWGAACACKFSAVLFGVVIVVFLIAHWRMGEARRVPVILIAAFLAFRVFHPIAFRGEGGVFTLWGLLDVRIHPQFWSALAQQAAITRGDVDVPFNLQWIGRTDFLWPLYNLGIWALGWPLLLCGIGGIIIVARRVLCRRHDVAMGIAIAALWIVLCFAFYGAQFSKFTRYYLVATPFVCLLAAWLLTQLKPRPVRLIVTSGVLSWCALWSLSVASIYTREHPRVAATRWIVQNIPVTTPVANETIWDEALPLGNSGNHHALDLKLFEPDDEAKRAHLLATLDQTQWIFISSPRVWKVIPRLPQRYPVTTRYYRALFDGRLGFEKACEFHSYPQIFGWRFNDENAEEALHVYDHPRVMLFRKTSVYSHAKAASILQ